MALRVHHHPFCGFSIPLRLSSSSSHLFGASRLTARALTSKCSRAGIQPRRKPALRRRPSLSLPAITASALDLTEENVRLVLAEAKTELAQIFDAAVGITGEVDLAELDGPFVKLRFKGRFWHKRSTVLARLDNYLRNRIPEILEVEIEDEKQLDDSPASF